jgi:uncharacterized protein (DUF362 family)/NAD-dependent dihydropyrimidine dehydrogenase PreA subunit
MSASFEFPNGRVDVHTAWTTAEVKSTVEQILNDWAEGLPKDPAARILIKPNLNNDLVALVGNCVDLRVLCSLVEGLLNRGYRNLVIADGSNVGIDKRNIDTMRRLRVDRLAERYGIDLLNLNHAEGTATLLHGGANPEIANPVLEADFLISVPKVKTHAEAGLSCAMKNWVGIVCGQQKRQVHYDLQRNILGLNETVQPDLILVDGLIGMEGNGPGDGEVFRFGHLIASDNAFLNDLVVCRLVDMPLEEVPYLVHAQAAGHIRPSDVELAAAIQPRHHIQKAPQRSKLAELSEAKSLLWLKRAVQPILRSPRVLEGAYKLKIIQDVYFLEDDTIRGFSKTPETCGDCRRCEDFCPTHLSAEEIGVKTDPEDCIQCLYCWWVCPKGALTLDGELNHLGRQVDRYKSVVEAI